MHVRREKCKEKKANLFSKGPCSVDGYACTVANVTVIQLAIARYIHLG